MNPENAGVETPETDTSLVNGTENGTENKEPEMSQEEKDAKIAELRKEGHENYDKLLDLALVWDKEWAVEHARVMKGLKKLQPKQKAAAKPKAEKIEEEVVNMPDDVFEALLEKRRQKKNAGADIL